MQERLQRARPLGVDLVQTIYRFVQPNTAFDLPAHTVEVGHLPGADPGRQIREEETIALGRVDTDETEMEWALVPADVDVSIDGPAVEDEDPLLEQGIEVSTGEELLGHLSACDIVHFGFPVVLQA